MMHCTTDYLFVPPFMAYPTPDVSYNAPTNRLSQSLLHLHVVGSTPQFTSISVGGSPVISNYLLSVRPQKPVEPQISNAKSLIKLLRGLRLSEEQLVANR
ncbi:hypothetical protein OESDEN_01795 [Oesophagostomum dentatum]|uniref:Uncharacterized protein n=1 Tax=Oesophagostomum dentatum TaxID=61180 RepID=A0A0B1TLV9_OESDE|nr:hypothetical protein OESDEN_01795 [Oesophagostomum dentatum]